MNNEEYYESLNVLLNKLKELRKEAMLLAKGIIGNNLLIDDLFFSSALDRSVSLLDGIVKMLEERNLMCVGILLRSQIDNCMRIFSAFIAEDKVAFIEGFLRGKSISDFKDNRGNKMRDKVLRERLEEYDSRVSDVYKKSSGYVHLSNIAFYSSVSALNINHIEFSIGLPIREDSNEILLEGAAAFIHYTLLQNQLLQSVVDSKKLVDENSNL